LASGQTIEFDHLIRLYANCSIAGTGTESMSTRYYLFPDDGEPQRLSRRLVEGLIFGKDSLPQYAETRQKVASVALENDGLKPVRILSTQGTFWDFDREGGIREGLQRSFSEFMEAGLDTQRDAGTVVALRPRLNKQRLEAEHRWALGRSEIDRIVADIWPKDRSSRLKQVKGVSRKKPPLTFDAKLALDEVSSTFWKISSAMDHLKEPSLKGLAFEARQRSVQDHPDYGSLYRAVAEMAEQRLEIIKRRRSSKGVWYAALDVTQWDAERVGRLLVTFHERCDGRAAAVKAARRLLTEHASKFAEDITIEAEILTELEWKARELEGD
jgi:hypothetical protein